MFFFFEKEGDKLSFNLFKSRSSEKKVFFNFAKHSLINCEIIKTGLIDTANYYDISMVRRKACTIS